MQHSSFRARTITFAQFLAWSVLCATLPVPLKAQMPPTYTTNIPMRDGKVLAADVYVPAACSDCPTILVQTPYNKNMFHVGLPLGFGANLNSSPYAWVIVDWRGFYGSASAAVPQPNRGQDGYDVIDWIIAQPWSNGLVGTWGPSALGVIQYQTAKENHPNHTCAVPLVAHPQQNYQDYFYGGVLEKSRLETLDGLGYGLSPTILSNVYYSVVWQVGESNTWYPASINLPTLQIGGWYDHTIDRMMNWYKAVRTSAPLAVRDKQWLLVGPWVHGGTGAAYVGSATQGQLSYPNAAFKSDTMALTFFARYLLGANNGWENTPRITYHKTGPNGWATSNADDIAIVNTTALHLNTSGQLRPQSGTGTTAFTCDPHDPSPTIGGPTLHQQLQQGPYDQASLESRPDVVTFSTGPLSQSINATGRIKLNLYVACSQPDADIMVRLTDRYPDDRDMLITDGTRRMRSRNGYTQAAEAFMSPGQVYPVEIQLPFTDYTWAPGHALKVYISGNSAIRWDVNLQNGGTMYAAGDTNTAVITLHHDAQYPSRVVLPTNDIITGIAERTDDGAPTVFPNPVTDVLHIARSGPTTYRIHDASGRSVKEAREADIAHGIPVADLPAGVYLIRLAGPDGTSWERFVKVDGQPR